MASLYFGSSIEQWGLFFLSVAAAFVFGKIVNFLVDNYLKKMATHTKTEFDDILLGAFEKPLLLALLAAGILVGQNILTLEPDNESILVKIEGIIITIAIGWFLINLVDGFVKKFLTKLVSRSASKLDDQLLPIVSKSLKIIFVLLTIIVISDSFLGIDVTGPLLGLGIGGVALALAAQAILSDVFGGISIFTSRPFQIGDEIIVDGIQSTVEEVHLRHTRARNLENRIITYPNSKLASAAIENISSSLKRRILLNLGLTYDMPPKKIREAKEIVLRIINEHPGCEKPPVLVSFSEFKDFSLNLIVIYFISDLSNWGTIRGEINERIKEEFEKAKIKFAFPTQTVFLQKPE